MADTIEQVTTPTHVFGIFIITNVLQNNVIFRQKKKLDLAGRGFSRGKDISPERLQAVRVRKKPAEFQ